MGNAESRVALRFRIPHSAFRIVGAVLLVLGAIACRGDGRTPLVIYSPHGRDLLTLFEQRFEALQPDVDVRWLDMGSQEVYDRVRSERANPQADVWFGGPSTIFARGARDSCSSRTGRPGPTRSRRRGRGAGRSLLRRLRDAGGASCTTSRRCRPPRRRGDWDDLLDPRWTGKMLIRDPMASGTMRAVWGMIIERRHPGHGRHRRGLRLAARGSTRRPRNTCSTPAAARREDRAPGRAGHDLGLARHPDQPAHAACRSAIAFPTSGTPRRSRTPIALVRGAPHAAAARAFIDFVGGHRGAARSRRARCSGCPARTRPAGRFAARLGARGPADMVRRRRGLGAAGRARAGVDAVVGPACPRDGSGR